MLKQGPSTYSRINIYENESPKKVLPSFILVFIDSLKIS